MRLYSGTTKSLIEGSTFNRIGTKLKDAFFQEFRYAPPLAEVNSWNNSLRAVSQVFQAASLLNHGVLLELQLPLTSKRLDCLVTGYDDKKTSNAVIIELKQWGGCSGASGKNEVANFVGGKIRDVLHPAVQVGQYMSGELDQVIVLATSEEAIPRALPHEVNFLSLSAKAGPDSDRVSAPAPPAQECTVPS